MTLPPSIRRDASTLSARLPSLIIAARRVAQTVRHGVHGRRRAGSGETFWQFRPFLSGEPSSRVDWRRSAREERAFVREREWEAAHTVWIWFDRSPSMQFGSSLAPAPKLDRAALLALAFADLCVRGGERAGLLGLTRPLASQGVVERFAEAIATDERLRGASQAPLPPAAPAAPRSMVLLIGDFLSEPERIASAVQAVAAEGASRRTGDDRRSDRGDLSVRRQHRVSRSGRLAAPAHAPGAGPARRLSRAARRPSRGGPGHLRPIGWGMSIHRTDGSPAEMLLALRMRLSAPEPGAGLEERLSDVRIAARLRGARGPRGADWPCRPLFPAPRHAARAAGGRSSRR